MFFILLSVSGSRQVYKLLYYNVCTASGQNTIYEFISIVVFILFIETTCKNMTNDGKIYYLSKYFDSLVIDYYYSTYF